MSFIRSVLGDLDPAGLKIGYAHEHIIISGGWVGASFPDFALDSVEKSAEELIQLKERGVDWVVDSMPAAAGRDVFKLAEVSRRSGVHIVCPTGLHLPLYYPPGHWSHEMDEDSLASLFIEEITHGIDARDRNGPWTDPTPHRAGVIKVAGGRDKLSERELRAFRAAAVAQVRTGCPILTHTEQGTAGLEQARVLLEGGASPQKVVLSHLDRNPDPDLHREVLATGVGLEYDSAFRWKGPENPTLDLILRLYPDFPDQILLGMDAARPSYWRSYGGSPGLDFLVGAFSDRLRSEGLTQEDLDRIFIHNPRRSFSFHDNSPQGEPL